MQDQPIFDVNDCPSKNTRYKSGSTEGNVTNMTESSTSTPNPKSRKANTISMKGKQTTPVQIETISKMLDEEYVQEVLHNPNASLSYVHSCKRVGQIVDQFDRLSPINTPVSKSNNSRYLTAAEAETTSVARESLKKFDQNLTNVEMHVVKDDATWSDHPGMSNLQHENGSRSNCDHDYQHDDQDDFRTQPPSTENWDDKDEHAWE